MFAARPQDILEFHLANSQRDAVVISANGKFPTVSCSRCLWCTHRSKAAKTEQEIRDRVRSSKKEVGRNPQIRSNKHIARKVLSPWSVLSSTCSCCRFGVRSQFTLFLFWSRVTSHAALQEAPCLLRVAAVFYSMGAMEGARTLVEEVEPWHWFVWW